MTQIHIKLNNCENTLIEELSYLREELSLQLFGELRRELWNELNNELWRELERELKNWNK